MGIIPLIFLIATVGVAAFERIQSDRISTQLKNSDVLIVKAQDLGQATFLMEKAMQKYIATPTAAYRASYGDKIANVKQAAAELARLTKGNPVQAQRVAAMTVVLNRALVILNRYTQLTVSGKTAAADALLKSPEAKGIGDRWNAETVAFVQYEQSKKFADWDKLRAQSQLLDYIALGIAMLGFITTAIVLWRFVISMAEGALERESQLKKYRLLAEHTHDIILFVRRSDGRIIDANAAASAYGYTSEELRSIDARSLRPQRLRDTIDRDLEGVETKGAHFETMHIRKDCTEFPVEVSAEVAMINGEPLVAEIIRDITERKESEKRVQEAFDHALEASTLKSQFVATMSHEIRTPMNAVIGMTELLLDSGLNEEQLHCATVIRDSGQLLLDLINDILDFSRIEAKRVDLELVQFPIVQLVESIATLLSRQASEKHLSLMTYIDPAIPRMLVGDPGRLRQVLVNLVGNALKFTHHGSVIATVDLLEKSEELVRLRFSVADTGIGIPQPAIDRLFEPFRQADGSTTRKYGGSGLGLSISRGLVELMGGWFNVTSTVGEGSRFSFDIDFRYVASVEVAHPGTSGRAIIVDDDQITRDVFHRYFTSWNIRADTASGGSVAIEMMRRAWIENDPYTMALVDLSMPGMDGFAFGERILADPDLRSTRLIMVTAYDRFGQGRRAIAAGFAAYLSKPLRQSELYDAIVDGHPQPLPIAPVAEASELSNGTVGRVLVAEDNATNRHIALLQLQKLGIAGEAVADGRQAIAAVMDGSFDVILMDCQMPNMDGFEATRHIRKAEARTGGHIRIIAMTANALSEDRLACLAAGMDDYLAKPVTLEELHRVLHAGKSAAIQGTVDPAPLNFERLLDLFGNDRDRTLRFLDETLPKLRDISERLHSASSLREQRAAAHELKGAAANIGADELASAAARSDLAAIDAALARLNAATTELIR